MRVIPPLSQAEEAEAKKSQLIGAILFGVANQTSAYVVEHGHAHITIVNRILNDTIGDTPLPADSLFGRGGGGE